MFLVCVTQIFFQNLKPGGCQLKDPIFILGLPRAGSTLIEQILASHSMIDGTLELPNILSLAHSLRGDDVYGKKGKYPKIIEDLTVDERSAYGNTYINETSIHRKSAPFFTDKMPNNFRHIGLIKLILPKAKIIDIRRNSMSACFSCYKQLFAEGQEFTYSQERLASYYNNYIDLMNHWNEVLPNEILSIAYEDLITNFEDSVNTILEYCDLPFEQSCIEFYKNKRSVKTPSAQQVRQPIYTSGLDYWKNYDPYLDELKKHLNY